MYALDNEGTSHHKVHTFSGELSGFQQPFYMLGLDSGCVSLDIVSSARCKVGRRFRADSRWLRLNHSKDTLSATYYAS